MLQLLHLKKYYATQKAVDDISFTVPQGSIFGLLGPNGAGKSSILRMVTGITMPDEGQILFNQEPFDMVKHSGLIGYMPEERGLYKKMKIGEQVLYLAQLKGLSKQDALAKIKYWFQKLEMESWWNKKVEDLSKGMSQKLQFVTTVLHQPKLLILDEPFSGLDPVNSEVIKNEIFELAKQGTTIIFSTHRMEQVEEICEHIVLINQGKIILEGQVPEIKQRFKLGEYKLVVDGNLEPFTKFIQSNNGNEFVLRFQDKSEYRQVLQYCLDHQFDILSFNEMLPSLHEIFIQEVEGTAGRKFDR
jgi:ABC-2 type transport system ATP-binding protein